MNKKFKILSIINIITILLSITLILKPISVYAEPGEEGQNIDNNTNTETGGKSITPSENTNTGTDNSNNNTTEENTEKKEETKPVSNTTNNNSSSNANSNSNSAKKTVVQNVKSSVATLSNLGITPNDFSGFKENKTEYETSVPNNVTEVEVYATKKDSKASITGTGKVKLSEGNNVAKVVVTAEDGTTKTYTITIKRLKDGEEEAKKAPLDATFGLDELEIKGLKLEPAFSKNVYKYTVNYEGDEKTLDVIAKSNQDGASVEIVGNDNLINGQNVITILVTNAKENEVLTYQITINKNVVSQDELNNHLNDGNNQSKIKMWIIIGLSAVIFIGIIAFFKVKSKKKKMKIQQKDKGTDEKRKPYYYYEDEDDKKYELDDKAKMYEEIVKQSRLDRKDRNREIEIKEKRVEKEENEEMIQKKNTKKKGKHQRKH